MLLTCRYKGHRTVSEGLEIDAGLIGHVHLNEVGAFAFNLFITRVYFTIEVAVACCLAIILLVSNLRFVEQKMLKDMNISMHEVLQKCQETINSFRKKKKVTRVFKRTALSFRLVSVNL